MSSLTSFYEQKSCLHDNVTALVDLQDYKIISHFLGKVGGPRANYTRYRVLPGGWEKSGRFCSLTPRTREKSRYLVKRNSESFQVVCTHGIVAAEHKSAGSSNSLWFVSPTWPISTPRASLD